VRTGTLKVSKSRHNRDRPFGRTRGSDRASSGEARKEASSENRDIGDPGSKGFVHWKIAIRDFPIRPRSVGPHRLSGGQVADFSDR
jgi:hypothetical protein